MLAFLAQINETQWWPADDLLQYQMKQLGRLVRHCRHAVPFYRDRLAAVDPEDPDPAAYRNVPTLTRSEVQEHSSKLLSRAAPEDHGGLTTRATSGSTGEPVQVQHTAMFSSIQGACLLRNHHWHGRSFRGRLASIHVQRGVDAAYPGYQQADWGWPAAAIYPTGPAALLHIATPIPQQAQWLREQDPDYLLSCPSNLTALAEYCMEHDIKLPHLEDISTVMEVVTPEFRETCRAAWNAPVVDTYSCVEAGNIAMQCPVAEHCHVPAESVLVEVIDEHGQPCGPGEVGRVVVTALHNFAMPLLRYELGDHAEVGGPCECGRGLPVLKRIMGRTRNMLMTPDGQQHWPRFGRRRMLAIAPIRQYQFVQHAADALEVRLTTARPLTVAEEQALVRHIHERTPYPYEVTFTYSDEIPPGPGGKREDFRCEVADGEAV